MPEGDTVWLAARRLHEAFAGRPLTHTDFRVPRLATADLTGRTVGEVVSRGKHLLFRVDASDAADAADAADATDRRTTGREPVTLHTHFRMDGTWRVSRAGTPWRGGPPWQVRVVLANEEWQAVGYRLPVVELLATRDEDRVVGHLGPDLLGPDWDEDEALRRLRMQCDRAVGPALLDQRNLAGIGNLYKTETLFLSGVTPWTRVGAVDDLAGLLRRARRLMQANQHHWHQTTTGDTRRGEEHWVFERPGRPCRRCGTPVVQAMQSDGSQPDDRQPRAGQFDAGRAAGDGRAAGGPPGPPYERLCYWCPSCQRGPAPTG